MSEDLKTLLNNENVEIRTWSKDIQVRAIQPEDSDEKQLEGHAIVFNQRSKIMYDYDSKRYFEEIILPEAVSDEVLTSNDVYLVRNHNPDMVIARTVAGNLSLSVDEKGLLFRAIIPNTTTANDVYENVRVGNFFENSFAFTVAEDRWEKNEDDEVWTRTITKIGAIYDVSVVTNGAYSNTDVAVRSYEKHIESEEEEEDTRDTERERLRMRMRLNKIKK